MPKVNPTFEFAAEVISSIRVFCDLRHFFCLHIIAAHGIMHCFLIKASFLLREGKCGAERPKGGEKRE